MIADGKKLAEEIVEKLEKDPVRKFIAGKKIGVIMVEPNPATDHFVKKKQAVAEKLGLTVKIFEFAKEIGVAELISEIRAVGEDPEIFGIIVQLPLPKHLDCQKVFNAIPAAKDVDLLSEEAFHFYFLRGNQDGVLPPVVGAIDYLVRSQGIALENKSAVVLGAGKLIGMPSLAWLAKKAASVCSFAVWSETIFPFLEKADIVIAGLGKPGILTGEHLKDGVCVFDVGYSVIDGKVKGDVDFDSVKDKAGLITPVPGGIGPLTVAVLFENLFKLYKLRNK